MTPPVILPFQALRYNAQKISALTDVIAPPYDVISPTQQEALYNKNPYNIVRLDLRRGTDFSGTQDHYEQVGQDFQGWIQQEILKRDTIPAIYLYEQEFTAPDGTPHTRRGAYLLRRLEPFGKGTVYPHERTLPGPKKDRLALMKATQAHLSPIFGLLHDPSGQAKELFAKGTTGEPLLTCQDEGGQTHRLWAITDTDWIATLTAALEGKSFVIADGHHRYETALTYSKEQEGAGYVLMFCEAMDDPGLLVLPTHRLLKNIPNFSGPALLEKIATHFEIKTFTGKISEWTRAVQEASTQTHTFGLLLRGDSNRYLLRITQESLGQIPALQKTPEPLRSLDAAIVHKGIMEGLLKLPEEDQYNLERVAYLKSEEELFKQIQSEPAQVGFFLNPAPLEQVEAIARAGQFMPPKTTYFYPKLPTGLVIHKID